MVEMVFALYGTNIAGGTRAVFEVANRLSGRGYNVRIVALGGRSLWFNVKVPVHYVEAPMFIRFAKPLIRVYKLLKYKTTRVSVADYLDVDGFARLFEFRADLVRALTEKLNEFRADVAIATWYPTALAVWLSNATKKLYFMQDFHELVLENDGYYGLRLFEATLHLPFYFLANSTYTRDIILNYNKDAKITVTGVGVDQNIFYPRKSRMIDSRGRHVVMAIIRNAKFKGGDIALKTLNIINKEMPIHAIFVSEGRAIERFFKENKPEFTYTIFRGVDDETLAKLYSSADVFIFTSYKESFGLPPLEAMASGTPVVTTDCGGIRDYVIDGYNALLVRPGDPNAVAEAVLKILKDDKLREKLIEHGIQTAKQWTWDKVVDRFEQAIKES
jgi:glycosyltransferase involved in cell wall biosynthesis